MVTVIGIGGGSGAGKTTLVKSFKDNPYVTIINQDNYFHNNNKFIKNKKYKDSDSPSALKIEDFRVCLQKIKKSETVLVPRYDKKIMNSIGSKLVIPRKIVLVEGFHLYLNSLIPYYDITFFLEAKENILYLRRRKRQKDLTNEYFQEVAMPTYLNYIEPTKKECNFILNGEKTTQEIRKDFINCLSQLTSNYKDIKKLLID